MTPPAAGARIHPGPPAASDAIAGHPGPHTWWNYVVAVDAILTCHRSTVLGARPRITRRRSGEGVSSRRIVNVLVESPRGSTIKFEYDQTERVMTLSRPLPAGLVYPFDWGFIPGTRAADGDPLDAFILWDGASYPGILRRRPRVN